MLRLFDSSVISNSGFYGSGLFIRQRRRHAGSFDGAHQCRRQQRCGGAGLYVDGAARFVTVTNGSTIAGSRVTWTTSASRGGGVFVTAGLLRVGDSTIAQTLRATPAAASLLFPQEQG